LEPGLQVLAPELEEEHADNASALFIDIRRVISHLRQARSQSSWNTTSPNRTLCHTYAPSLQKMAELVLKLMDGNQVVLDKQSRSSSRLDV